VKGIVFNLLEEVVRQEFGEDTWDTLLERAGFDGAYTSLGSYADAELLKLVDVAAAALNMSPDEVLRWFGRKAIPLLAERYSAFFAPHQSARPFILTLNHVIHPEVRKIYPGADVPVFDFDTSSDEVVVMTYESARKLCSFAAGLIEGAAGHYGEDLDLQHPSCMRRGDPTCVFAIALQRASAAA
jgi:hypothetical protein